MRATTANDPEVGVESHAESWPLYSSLFRKILPASPCGSGFLPAEWESLSPKSLAVNGLNSAVKKINGTPPWTKSLFCNILPASSSPSRFARNNSDLYKPSYLSVTTYAGRQEKLCGSPRQQPSFLGTCNRLSLPIRSSVVH